MKETLLQAKKCLFVSAHTKNITEEQFGVRLPNSDIVINPVKTAVEPLPFPSTNEGYRLACVGRLFVIDKGQDMLLRIMAQPKWRERDISLSFVGSGPDMDGLKELAQLLELNNISFSGYTNDLKQLWNGHHALILASRSEGLPLTIIEAMSLGRPVIATNAGGNSEIIEDQVTGFVSEINENDLDNTMEIAWAKREEWKSMGIKAAKHINEIIPKAPERIFVNLINSILND
jgi:glycosyltransferase involved in cell wall biosynthesis